MSSTVSSYEPPWSPRCWNVRDGCSIAAYTFRFSYIVGWVEAPNDSRKM